MTSLQANTAVSIAYNNNYFLHAYEKSSSVARQNQGIKQTRNRKQCMSCQRMDEEARRLRRIGNINEIGF